MRDFGGSGEPPPPLELGPVFHVNVNCHDLASGEPFYRGILGLHPILRTARSLPGVATFGWSASYCEGWMFSDHRRWGGPLLDLIEWDEPKVHDARPWDLASLGLNRLLISGPARVPGGSANTRAFSSTRRAMPSSSSKKGEPELIGLPSTATWSGQAPFTESDSACNAGRKDERAVTSSTLDGGPFFVHLTETRPEVDGNVERVGNDAGYCRLALQTDDIAGDYRRLIAGGVPCLAPPEVLSMGPGREPLSCLFFRDPDGALLELIQLPKRPRRPQNAASVSPQRSTRAEAESERQRKVGQ